MGIMFLALAAAAALLAYAIIASREIGLMVGVSAYAAVVAWIIQSDLSLLMAALGMAIVLGMMGLVTVVCREATTHEDTSRHNICKLNTNNRPMMDNIGS